MLINPSIPFRGRRGRIADASPPAPPINAIDTVFIEEDSHTIDVLFTAGTEVTAVNDPSDYFFVNDPGGKKAASDVDIVGPSHVRFVFSPHVNFPATWEVDSADLFTFASGVFAGPNSGDVIFPE
jgi:hypothetical protein